MKRISEFLVKRRNVMLAVMLVIAAVCGILSQRVNIITDMTKFLPDSSHMKKGVDIMAEEFDGLSAGGSVRLMSTDISEEDKQSLLNDLAAIYNVSSVEYKEGSEEYNKGDHCLFVINSEYSFSDPEMQAIEREIAKDICPRYGLVYDTNDTAVGSELPLYIVIIALILLMIILFIMCESWFEPVIFLVTIGVAVVINAGTNIFLNGVSNVTKSIASILQLVLSMDYSIILINRYRQEQGNSKDNIAAMISAVSSAAASVMSSSLTTVAGLLSLVFMSFKIGADLGIVLAKGVFISMICIFTVLPALIIMSSGLIEKTAKKVPQFRMDKLAAFYAKTKAVYPCLLVVFFAAVTLLKGNTKINYSMPKPSEIVDIFPRSNSVVVLYSNSDEEAVKSMAAQLESDPDIQSVYSYSTTLARQYNAEQMTEQISDMAAELPLKPWMLDLIYYDKFGGEISPLELKELLSFIKSFAADNSELLGGLGGDMLPLLDTVSVFADREELSRERSAAEISMLFGTDEVLISQLFALTGRESMTLAEFMQTVQNLSGSSAGDSSEMKAQLEMARLFTDPQEYSKERSASEIAKIFGVDQRLVSQLMLFSGSDKISIEKLVTLISSVPQLTAMLPPETAEKLGLVGILTDPAELSKQRTMEEISSVFGIDRSLLAAAGRETMSINELMELAEQMTGGGEVSFETDNESFMLVQQIVSDTMNGKKYSPADIVSLFGGLSDMLNEDTVGLVYELYFSSASDISGTMSMEELFGYILEIAGSGRFAGIIDGNIKAKLKQAETALADGKKQLVGENHSIMMLDTHLPDGAAETDSFIESLDGRLSDALGGEYYLIGNSPMQYEMSQSFTDEFNKISVITAAAIFAVILITFRSLPVPAVLILVIQSAVYATMVIIGIAGSGMYYLALLIVQSILMGATVDYGILFTSYYRENRKTLSPPQALAAAYNGSMHTILTSGLIIVIVTFILGFAFGDPAINQIVHIISLGAACAISLIVFVLPGVLIALDRLTGGVKKSAENEG